MPSSFSFFLKNCLGCINNPYVTYRRLSLEHGKRGHVLFIFLFTLVYFLFASLIRVGKAYPYLLTVHFNLLLFSALGGFLFVAAFFYSIGRLLGRHPSGKTLIVLWGYSLLPTISWFFLTSLLYIFLPPPRTDAFTGKLFSIVFLTLTFSLLLWKLILYYLTLRFGLRCGLFRIFLLSVLFVPFFIALSSVFYMFNIFRVPFL